MFRAASFVATRATSPQALRAPGNLSPNTSVSCPFTVSTTCLRLECRSFASSTSPPA